MPLELEPRRQKLVEEFADFAKAVARKLAQDLPISTEDAISAGYEGLVQAAHRISYERWDPNGGPFETNFRSLAYLRIRGAIYDEARRNTFTKRRGLEKGIKFDMVSLDKTRATGDGDVLPILELEHHDGETTDLLDCLDELERGVILGTQAGYQNKEIARLLGVSQARIPSLRRSAREKVIAHLGYHPVLDTDGESSTTEAGGAVTGETGA